MTGLEQRPGYRIGRGSLPASKLSLPSPCHLTLRHWVYPSSPPHVNTSTSWCELHSSQTHWWCCPQVGQQLRCREAATSLHRHRLASTHLFTRQQALAAPTVLRAGRCVCRLAFHTLCSDAQACPGARLSHVAAARHALVHACIRVYC